MGLMVQNAAFWHNETGMIAWLPGIIISDCLLFFIVAMELFTVALNSTEKFSHNFF
jgi:hypothetical protein